MPAEQGQAEDAEAGRPEAGDPEDGDIVVCSLEPWDELWRRNQFLVSELLRAQPARRVLFVEPALDPLHELRRRSWPSGAGLRAVRDDGRLWALRPTKWLPRAVSARLVSRAMATAARRAAQTVRLRRPLLWVNDLSYTGLAASVDWPVVYDVTDDWLEAAPDQRTAGRLREQEAALLGRAEEVVVVSPGLAISKGAHREVHLVPNAVDAEHFRGRRPRPADLPPGPVAVYIGTQHEQRLDVELCAETAFAIAPAKLVLVGQNALSLQSSQALRRSGCALLGPRPYADVPAYFQHADVVVVPHPVNSFTESLDPIKAYECLAAGRPTVSTPVAGMRDVGPPVEVCDRSQFAARVKEALGDQRPSVPGAPPTWAQRALEFERVLASARAKRAGPPGWPGSRRTSGPDGAAPPPPRLNARAASTVTAQSAS